MSIETFKARLSEVEHKPYPRCGCCGNDLASYNKGWTEAMNKFTKIFKEEIENSEEGE